jgi:hypothetical protein
MRRRPVDAWDDRDDEKWRDARRREVVEYLGRQPLGPLLKARATLLAKWVKDDSLWEDE